MSQELKSTHLRTVAEAAVLTPATNAPQTGDQLLALLAKLLGATAPTGAFKSITPHDTTPQDPPVRSIYVGGAGDVVVKNADGTAVTFTAVPVGMILPIACTIVKATGTTATNLIAL